MSSITDRYGNELKKADKKPTVMQSVNSWYLLNELLDLGYPHSFQHEKAYIVDYMYNVSKIIDKAFKIKRGDENE